MNTFIEKDVNVFPKLRLFDIYMVGHKGYISGGCFKNFFIGQKLKDVDIFFESESDHAAASLHFSKNDDYIFSYENKNVIAYKNTKTNTRVELIKSSFGPPEEMLKRFDFSISKFAYIKKVIESDDISEKPSIEYKCFFHTDFFEHLICKKLVIEPEILFPVSTFERTLRYVKYGFGLCRESKQNLLNSLNGADISDLSSTLYNGID